jgi:hypothetical protein
MRQATVEISQLKTPTVSRLEGAELPAGNDHVVLFELVSGAVKSER